jgi:Xaa-Pro dipeptidase
MQNPEIQTKQRRLADFLNRHRLDAVLLQHRNNFAWITAGRDNHIANNSPVGVAAILATADHRLCLANSIEAPRMRDEELRDAGIDVVDYPWYDRHAAQKTLREVIAGRKVAADVDELGIGLPSLPGDFAELRWSLTDAEIDRYREGALRTVRAMEQACRDIQHNMTEHEAAAILDHHIHATGCNPIVTLIASDERIENFRHPIPTDHRIQRYVMLVTCAEFGGLISCLTRFVSFQPVSDDLKRKQQAVCNIDAAVNLATRPGRTLGRILADLQRAYADNGHPDQWRLHHQGGSTGYAGREAFATPDSPIQVLENQAFAWNPSITGVKSEDTILCTPSGIEFLTQPTKDWPMIQALTDNQPLPRPDMLLR